MTSADFKATVQDYLERQPADRLPRPRELMLVSHSDGIGWKRATMRRPFTWIASWMVGGFIIGWKPDRLAIVAPTDQPRQFRVAFAERGSQADGTINDQRLATLVAAARREWNRPAPGPLRTFFGRPWPIPVLSFLLVVELGPGLIRLWRGVGLGQPLAYFAHPLVYLFEVALIVATVFMLWRRPRIGYVLALALSALQFVSPIAAYFPYLQSGRLGTVVVWLLLGWSYPAAIWVALGYLWLEPVRRRTLLGSAAGPTGAPLSG